jgi:hypothetical protein
MLVKALENRVKSLFDQFLHKRASKLVFFRAMESFTTTI